jgi:hypothetical protein
MLIGVLKASRGWEYEYDDVSHKDEGLIVRSDKEYTSPSMYNFPPRI